VGSTEGEIRSGWEIYEEVRGYGQGRRCPALIKNRRRGETNIGCKTIMTQR